jgi:hypothetical protein
MLLNASIQFALLLAVLTAYGVAAWRYRRLRHPLAIALAVIIVGVAVSVLNEWFRRGWSGVPGIAFRSLIGSAWWGALIGAAAWIVRRLRTPGRARGREAPPATNADSD